MKTAAAYPRYFGNAFVRNAFALIGLCAAMPLQVHAQYPPAYPTGPAETGKKAAPFDITGYWVSVVTEDWRWRMFTPPIGTDGTDYLRRAGVGYMGLGANVIEDSIYFTGHPFQGQRLAVLLASASADAESVESAAEQIVGGKLAIALKEPSGNSQYPEVRWHTFEEWTRGQDWNFIGSAARPGGELGAP